MSLSDLEALKVSLGLDKPLIVRYFLWLGGLFQGILGPPTVRARRWV